MPFPPSHPALDRALAARGYVEPTPVQLAVVEADQNPERPGADMLVSAQTGSGKTVAFGLALASSLLGQAEHFDPASQPLALIIAPTRELAMQISREFEWLYADTGARIVQCVGGMSVRAEQQQLSRGAHIVIGTPGRLCDHLTRGFLDLSSLKVAVLDEADEMLDLGFREELETLLDATNAETRRTLLFSATIARGIAMLAKNYQRDAVRIDTTSATEPHGDIDYRAMRVSPGDTERAVVNVLRYFEAGGALVFCATREAVRHLHASLRERGFHAVGLSGEMNQRERNDALQSLRDGHAKVCVATDVAARGLDLPDLGLVIHADLPRDKATLLHRSGRTGRAGRKGTSVLLVTHTKRRRTEMVLQSANIDATWSGPPTAAEIRAKDRQRLLEHPSLQATIAEEDQSIAKQLADTIPAEQLAAALIGLLRNELPEPEDVSDDGRMRNAQNFEKQSGARDSGERPAPRGRTERGFAVSEGDGVWFRLNVGRRRNADPKWILPLVCRVGHITKAEIGPIRIFEDETKFEIVGHAAEPSPSPQRTPARTRSRSSRRLRPARTTTSIPCAPVATATAPTAFPGKSGNSRAADRIARSATSATALRVRSGRMATGRIANHAPTPVLRAKTSSAPIATKSATPAGSSVTWHAPGSRLTLSTLRWRPASPHSRKALHRHTPAASTASSAATQHAPKAASRPLRRKRQTHGRPTLRPAPFVATARNTPTPATPNAGSATNSASPKASSPVVRKDKLGNRSSRAATSRLANPAANRSAASIKASPAASATGAASRYSSPRSRTISSASRGPRSSL